MVRREHALLFTGDVRRADRRCKTSEGVGSVAGPVVQRFPPRHAVLVDRTPLIVSQRLQPVRALLSVESAVWQDGSRRVDAGQLIELRRDAHGSASSADDLLDGARSVAAAQPLVEDRVNAVVWQPVHPVHVGLVLQLDQVLLDGQPLAFEVVNEVIRAAVHRLAEPDGRLVAVAKIPERVHRLRSIHAYGGDSPL